MKKNIVSMNVWLIMLCVGLVALVHSCKKDVHPASTNLKGKFSMRALSATSDSALIAYKKSPHEITAGFYRVQGPCYGPGLNGSNFSAVPDSLDVLILFCFSPSSPIIGNVPGWINTLHAKGTKVIMTGNLNLVSGAGHDLAGYQATAKYIMDSLVNRYNLDGYDIDVESNPSGQTLTDMAGVYTALSAYLGPKSGTGKLLTFDTNQTGSNSLFQQVYTMVDYVWLQAYGRGASTLQSTWNTFSPYISASKFVPGFSFYEENGYPSNIWYDVTYPVNGTGHAFDYARWEPTGSKKGGVFGYAIDRDAPLTSATDNTLYVPTYLVTNMLIKIMNPAGGGGGTTGVKFFADINYGGASTSFIPKGNYTLSQLQAYGFVDNWASSVQIPAGWTVIMYSNDNFKRTSWTLTSSNANFTQLSPSANDVVTSVKIQ